MKRNTKDECKYKYRVLGEHEKSKDVQVSFSEVIGEVTINTSN